MATPGLLKITVFWNKGYDAIIPVNDVTKLKIIKLIVIKKKIIKKLYWHVIPKQNILKRK